MALSRVLRPAALFITVAPGFAFRAVHFAAVLFRIPQESCLTVAAAEDTDPVVAAAALAGKRLFRVAASIAIDRFHTFGADY